MKWFKHDTDASRSEGLAQIEKELGIWGYAAWFKMLEIIADKMDKTDRCYAEYPETKWAEMLRCKPKNLRPFLERCENVMKTKVERSGNVIKIEIPNLLKKKDEYNSKSGQKSESVGIRSLSISNPNRVNPNPRAKSIPYAEIIEDLNQITGRHYSATSKATQELIKARWNDGSTLEDFKKIHRNRSAKWTGTKWDEFLRPETLYSAKHFESYRNAPERPTDPAANMTEAETQAFREKEKKAREEWDKSEAKKKIEAKLHALGLKEK